ncbi:MAG: hypothetical protein MRY83_21605 [Flavobacteriales bacterium]|nr:hypothetical protein [Flavobacteriales bacterium]
MFKIEFQGQFIGEIQETENNFKILLNANFNWITKYFELWEEADHFIYRYTPFNNDTFEQCSSNEEIYSKNNLSRFLDSSQFDEIVSTKELINLVNNLGLPDRPSLDSELLQVLTSIETLNWPMDDFENSFLWKQWQLKGLKWLNLNFYFMEFLNYSNWKISDIKGRETPNFSYPPLVFIKEMLCLKEET